MHKTYHGLKPKSFNAEPGMAEILRLSGRILGHRALERYWVKLAHDYFRETNGRRVRGDLSLVRLRHSWH